MAFASSQVSPTELYAKYRTYALACVSGGVLLFLGATFARDFPNAPAATRQSFLLLPLGLAGSVSTLTAEHFGHARSPTRRDSRSIALATIRGLLFAVLVFAAGSVLNVLSAISLVEYAFSDATLHPLLSGILAFGVGVPLLVVA
jgi:hypothetical protein